MKRKFSIFPTKEYIMIKVVSLESNIFIHLVFNFALQYKYLPFKLLCLVLMWDKKYQYLTILLSKAFDPESKSRVLSEE